MQEMHRIIGNIDWVGQPRRVHVSDHDAARHILINTRVGDTAQQIEAGVDQLGFKICSGCRRSTARRSL